jgi:hypothetical protein
MMLGDHAARITNIEKAVEETKAMLNANTEKLDRILTVTEQAKGSWKTLATIGGSLAVVIEGLHQLSTWLHK